MNATLSIGQVAKRAGVNIETIRFYERKKLIPDPPRRQSGYRQYTDDAIDRLLFIRHAKELGFSLAEISDLLTLRVDPESSCADIKQRAEAKIASVRAKITSLGKIERALTKLATECSGTGPLGECPILEALEVTHDTL